MNKTIRYSSFENKFEVIYRNETPTIQMPPHTHNAIELYISLTPLSNILLGDNVMPLKENSLLIIPSYCIHQFTQLPDREYERYIITISTEWLENFIAGNKRYSYFTDTKNPIVITLDDKQKALLLNRMQDFIACKNNDTFSEISIFFDILKIIDGLIYTRAENDEAEKRVTGTQQTVNQIKADQIALLLGITQSLTDGDTTVDELMKPYRKEENKNSITAMAADAAKTDAAKKEEKK